MKPRVPSPRLCRALRIAFAFLVAAVILPAGWAGWLQAGGNFHTVLAGEVYRSAQPSAKELDEWTRAHGIRSVLNLRGASDQPWYRDEVAAAGRLGLTHADFAMRASQVLTESRARELIALMQSLPKPLLIHCQHGADRTGLAAALYLAAAGRGEAAAEGQISFRYGHVSLPVSAAWPMDETWEAMERPLGLQG
ncbi:MAG: tyrosine-protein phosphatase [Paracoccaceae bacterium]